MAGPTAAKARSAFRSAARCSFSPSAACRDGRRNDLHHPLVGSSDVARMDSLLASRRVAPRWRCRPAVRRPAVRERPRAGIAVLPAGAVLRPLPRLQRDRSRASDQQELALGGELDGGVFRLLPRPVRVGRRHLFPDLSHTARRAVGVRRRQAMDVEGPAHGWPIRNQCAAYPGQPPDPAGDGLAGRHSQLLHSGAAAEARRRAGPLSGSRNHGGQARALSPVLRGILRHRTFGHDRRDRGDGSRRFCRVADAAGAIRPARPGGRRAIP